MTVPYQPEPGCSAVQRQQAQQLHELRQQLKTAEDELQQQREQAVQHRAAMARVEAELAGLHEGEEPYEDERAVPTPAQWLWRWNRATPAERLERAGQALSDWELRRAIDQLTFYWRTRYWGGGFWETAARELHETLYPPKPPVELHVKYVTPEFTPPPSEEQMRERVRQVLSAGDQPEPEARP